ncbi:MAG: hypothetical protein LBG57_11905 [Treponema sp.]|jgi:hypothetical protein|nr:hypothetical protein [Treponema sp.]
MATLEEVKNYISTAYRQNGVNDNGFIWYMVEIEGHPSQPGLVMKTTDNTGVEWINFFSPIENLSVAQFDVVLENLCLTHYVGGLIKIEGGGYFIRSLLPLAITPLEELIKVITFLPVTAGELNVTLSGSAAN